MPGRCTEQQRDVQTGLVAGAWERLRTQAARPDRSLARRAERQKFSLTPPEPMVNSTYLVRVLTAPAIEFC